MSEHRFEGGCHCGNVSYVFETSVGLHVLGLRACQCTFCRHHGARTTSDPNGSIAISVRDNARLQRYRFGLKTADFLICRECGVFIGAMMDEAGGRWSTVNANTFSNPPPFEITGTANDFGAEDSGGRMARRAVKWTPVTEFSA